ncbi:MAG: aminoglycoside phosphotransferase family protein [Oscillospiraceae bacterium]|nr:aminoglycoside phosphotransferase family protein [Oscillospiraceae bacterium]
MDEIDLIGLFAREKPTNFTVRNTGRGNNDFREVIIAEWGEKRLVIKAADNGFTSPERIAGWQRCVTEYRKLGYYCPKILTARDGSFPVVTYKDRRCAVYGEEFSEYRTAEDMGDSVIGEDGFYTYIDEAILMNAKAAAMYFDFTEFPSGYCLFEKFDENDEDYEVMENALEWKRTADKLPGEFKETVCRIWERWNRDRESLEKIYPILPRSVFQGDINSSNCLLDEAHNFMGVLDFNLSGRDVFINYMFRELPSAMGVRGINDGELKCILHGIEVAKRVYNFSEIEKSAALLLYRVIKPLWITEVEKLKNARSMDDVKKCLDYVEYLQIREIDFKGVMGN